MTLANTDIPPALVKTSNMDGLIAMAELLTEMTN